MLRLTVFLIITLSWFIPTRPAISQFDIQKINSPKGIQAWFIPEPQLKIVSMTFSFLGGAAYVSPEQRGMAELLASMLMEGTHKRTNSELKDYLLDNGIELSFHVSQDRFMIELRTTNDNLNNAISIVREVMYTPRFNEADFQRLVVAQKVALEYQLAQPATQATFAHLQMIMANHPYAFLTLGTMAGLSNITTADLKAYLQKIMTRDSLIIGICGHLKAKRVGEIIDQLFGDLPNLSKLPPLAIPIGNFQGQQQILSAANPQAIVLFSQNGLSDTDPDFTKLYLLNHIIGQGMTSRLWRTIREQHGLAYSVGSNINNYDKMKLLSGNLGAEAINSKQAVDYMRKIWQDVKDNGVLESELADAKSYLIGIFPLMFASSTLTAFVLHYYQVKGLDEHYFKNRTTIINNITLAQINEFAKKFIDPKHLMVTIVEKPVAQKPTEPRDKPDNVQGHENKKAEPNTNKV